MAVSAQFPKRGATPSPRSHLAAATPYVAVPAAPPNFIRKPQQISFWGNYDHGDCVTAEEAFAKACNNPDVDRNWVNVNPESLGDLCQKDLLPPSVQDKRSL
jgi:hypothetical protein